MKFDTEQDWQNTLAAQPGLPSGVSAFLAWLMIWLRLCVERSRCKSWQAPMRAWQPNRQRQRMARAKIPLARSYGPYQTLAGRGKTPGQYAEWLALYSGYGRIRVYRMRYWRKTVKGKACPLGTEHEYWCDPLGRIGRRMSKLLCGVWAAHLWPGWRRLPVN